MTTLSMTTIQAKEDFSELINRVSHNKERVILIRRDKEIAAIIPIEDFALLQTLLDKNDVNEASEALKEARQLGTISLDDLKAEIGS